MSLEDLEGLRNGQQMVYQDPPPPTQQQIAVGRSLDEMYQQQMMMQGRPEPPGQYSERFLDRMLTVQLPAPELQTGNWFLKHKNFVETVGLLNLDAVTHHQMLRDYMEVEAIADGEGNDGIAEELQRELLFDMLCTKSRSDLPDKGIRERTAWISHRNTSEQTVRVPEDGGQKQGFIGTLLGRNR